MEELPQDILKSIVSLVDQDKTKRNLRLASKKWFELVGYNHFTLYLTRTSEWKQIADRLSSYKTPISLKLQKNFMTAAGDIIEHLTRLTNITALDIREISTGHTFVNPDFTRLTCLTNLKQLNSPLIPLNVCKHFTNLEKLAFNHHRQSDEPDLVETIRKLTNLSELRISYVSLDEPFDMFTDAHSKLTLLEMSGEPTWTDADLIRIKNLKEFTWNMRFLDNDASKIFSLKYWTALDSLNVPFQIEVDPVLNSKLTYLVLSKFPTPNLFSVKTLLNCTPHSPEVFTSLTALESLELNIATPEQCQVFEHIQSKKLTQLLAEFMDAVDMVPTDLIQRVSTMTALQALRLYNVIRDEISVKNLHHLTLLVVSGLNSFNIDHLDQLTQLRYLSLKNHDDPHGYDISLLTNLESLSFLGQPRDYKGISKLGNLTHLRICANDESDAFIGEYDFLSTLTSLEYLVVDNVHENLAPLLAPLTNLRDIEIPLCESDLDVLHFSSMQHLSRLYVYNTNGASGQHLTRVTSLQILKFNGNYDIVLNLPNLREFKY